MEKKQSEEQADREREVEWMSERGEGEVEWSKLTTV